jgi:hypothetical protein
MAQTRTGRPGTKVNGNTRTKARSGAAKPQNTAAKPTRKPAGRASRNGSRSGAANGSARSTPSRAKQSSNGHGGVEAAKNAVADGQRRKRSLARWECGTRWTRWRRGIGRCTRTGPGRRGKAPQGGLSYQIARPRNDGEGDWIVRRATRNGRRRDSPNARGGSSLETPLSRRGCTPRSDGETVNAASATLSVPPVAEQTER